MMPMKYGVKQTHKPSSAGLADQNFVAGMQRAHEEEAMSKKLIVTLLTGVFATSASMTMAQQDIRQMDQRQMEMRQMPTGEHSIEALRRAGFTNIHAIDYDTFQARGPDGRTLIIQVGEYDERIQDQERMAEQRFREVLRQAGYTDIERIDRNRLQAVGPDGRSVSVFFEGPQLDRTGAITPGIRRQPQPAFAPPLEQRADRPWQEQPLREGLLNEMQIQSILQARGMRAIEDFERVGTNYHARADWYGQDVEVVVDGRTGVVLRPRAMERDQIRARLQDEGWRDVADLERDGDVYYVRASRNGDGYELRVDARTGVVLDQRESG
jgi:hypothetical protein